MNLLFWKKNRHEWTQPVQRNARKKTHLGWVFAGNVAILMALWALGVMFINLGGAVRYSSLAEGQLAPATVVAANDFECIDLQTTALRRKQAGENVIPIFRLQPGIKIKAWRNLDKLAERAVAERAALAPHSEAVPLAETLPAAAEGNVPAAPATNAPPAVESSPGPLPAESPLVAEALADAADLLEIPLSGDSLIHLFPAGQEIEAADALKQAAATVLRQGILSGAGWDMGTTPATNALVDILCPAETAGIVTQQVVATELSTVPLAREKFLAEAQTLLERHDISISSETAQVLATALIQRNLEYDLSATQARRDTAGRDLKPVLMTVRAGTTIMEERMPVQAQTVEMMSAYLRKMASLETPSDRRMKRMGDYALMLIVLIVCVGWLRSSQPGAYTQSRRKWLLVLLALLAIGMESLYHYLSVAVNWFPTWVVPFAIPLALAPMLAVLMLGPAAALAVGLWVSLSSALIFERSFELLLLGLSGAVMATVMLRGNVRKRSQVMRAGLAVGLVESVMALALAVLNQHVPSTFLWQVATGFASGVFAAILATLILPLLEWTFRHTTDITLLELTDMAHPLLQRLALEAPGTYHHSLMVAALGQAAANRIGADGLQVAVCAYFHDIGKLAKPEFFTENQRGGENPHDSLAPSMSALVIQSHVKEGLTLAKRYKLPRLVCDAIRIHHGTSLTSYFYQLARQNLKASGLPEDPGLERSFRYDGPRPWTREQAILSLADTVEAASRSLEKATPSRITEMVENLMRDKLLDGQLDRAPLTMENFKTIRASFIFSLTNILHGRSPYPRPSSLLPSATTPLPPLVSPADDTL